MAVLRVVLLLVGVFLILDPTSEAKADYESGLIAAENGDYQTAFAEWINDAHHGEPKAQNGIGFLYQNGWGVPQDYQEALSWYLLSANQGYAKAQNNLGIMFINGWGVPRDFTQAAHWYQLAADQGHAWAQTNLGYLYEHGLGVPKNINEAVYLYRLAAEQGNTEASTGLKRLGFAEAQNQTAGQTKFAKAKNNWENIPTSIKVISYIVLTIITVIAYYKTVKLGREVYGLNLIFSASFGLILLFIGLAFAAFLGFDPFRAPEIINGVEIPYNPGVDPYIYSAVSGLCLIGAFGTNIKKSNLSTGIYFTLAQILSLAFFVILILAAWGWINERSKKLKM